MTDYIALLIAQDQTRNDALSALPNAPVRQEPARQARPPRAPLRRAAAGRLRSLAERLEPAPRERYPSLAALRDWTPLTWRVPPHSGRTGNRPSPPRAATTAGTTRGNQPSWKA